MAFVPKFSFGRRMLREDGGPNRDFLAYLFCDYGIAMQFLKDVALIWSEVLCNTCNREMTWSAEPSIPETFRWRCRKKVAGVKCSEFGSIKHGSWFQRSNLTFREVVLLPYDIVRCEPARRIKREYCLSSSTVADWEMFCRETMLLNRLDPMWCALFLCPRHVIPRLWSSPSNGIICLGYVSPPISSLVLRHTSIPTHGYGAVSIVFCAGGYLPARILNSVLVLCGVWINGIGWVVSLVFRNLGV